MDINKIVQTQVYPKLHRTQKLTPQEAEIAKEVAREESVKTGVSPKLHRTHEFTSEDVKIAKEVLAKATMATEHLEKVNIGGADSVEKSSERKG